jgi:hypothetical protein
MGLTGVIATAELQLRRVGSPWLHTETMPYQGLVEFFKLADASEHDWEHTVSWIDCLAGKTARGIFMRANHMTAKKTVAMPSLKNALAAHQRKAQGKPLSMPFVPPISLVNGLSLKPFNMVYYQLQKMKSGFDVAHYEPFSYPLDNLQHWNRMYGPRGFYQYQSVVPREVGQPAVQAMLDAIAASGEGSFLAVLKTFGNREAKGMLSFPQPGVTLALDFPTEANAPSSCLINSMPSCVKHRAVCIWLRMRACRATCLKRVIRVCRNFRRTVTRASALPCRVV